MSATKPLDRESIYAKLMLLSYAVGTMEDHRVDLDDTVWFAMAIMLSDIAREVWPRWNEKQHSPVSAE
ncbi:MAG: hypothetical protein LBR94_10105 [Desulfovibrio sp.]|jgi:hypothetical protein|nr:hypothetical protein [Desulfovibrio sp.]